MLATVRKEHEAVAPGRAPGASPPSSPATTGPMFVRLMDRNPGDTAEAQRPRPGQTIERVLDLLEWTDLNEFKATRIPK